MSSIQNPIHFERLTPPSLRKTLNQWGIAILAVVAFLFLGSALAADKATSKDAKSSYQQERAACMSKDSMQDRKACLREAGAALYESRRGGLTTEDQASYEKNALMRCNLVPQEDRKACEQRVHGQGNIEGSVAAGGILRETRTVEVITPEGYVPPPAPAGTPGTPPAGTIAR